MLEHSLLSEAVFHARADSGHAELLTLPQVLARLSAEEDLVFTHLRPHQRPAWHAFLVQLAWLALEDDEEPVQLPTAADAWTAKLRALTPGFADDAPWCLLNTDWQQPAFLQAPCSKAREADFSEEGDKSLQEIDMLVTSKNHSEKRLVGPLSAAPLDALVFALVTLQGWTKQNGPGRYPSMRMNGGYASRPQFRLIFSLGAGAEFKRDTVALVEQAEEMLRAAEAQGIGTRAGPSGRLLWLETWDNLQLALNKVHPLALEVSRRVRLARVSGSLVLRRASSKAARVADKERCGDVADPWIPIDLRESPSALNMQFSTEDGKKDSFGYAAMHRVLFDQSEYRLPLLTRASPSERKLNRPASLIAQALVGGKGTTEGFRRRDVQVPAGVLTRLASSDQSMATRASSFQQLAAIATGPVFRRALVGFVLDKKDDPDEKEDANDKKSTLGVLAPWVRRYDQAIDEAFFTELFESVESAKDDTVASASWARWLEATAWVHLAQATEALPSRDGQRWFARARAERFMRRAVAKRFGPLYAAAGRSAEFQDAIHGAESEALDGN